VAAVITAIRIESLRGIRSGALEGLSPLSVLVGANGCGKSTVLDALLLAAGGAPGDAVGRVVARRVELRGGARWLFWRGGRAEDPSARIRVEIEGAPPREATLRLLPDISEENEKTLIARRAAAPYAEIASTLVSGDLQLSAITAVAYDRSYAFKQEGPRELKDVAPVRLVDPRPGGIHAALSRSYTDAVEEGRLPEVERLVAEVVPGLTHIHNLSDDAGSGLVHLAFADHSVPVALSGDGIQTLVQVCFALAQAPGGRVLLEEPEANQHPRSIYQAARAVVAAVRRGVQVILSTHSLELIDALRAELAQDLSLLSVHHLACPGGALSVVRYSGSEVALARDAIGEDLR
jgi:predicted ATPase